MSPPVCFSSGPVECKNHVSNGENALQEFISEDDLKTFDGWLRYQGVEAASAEELETWRCLFDEARKRSSASPKVGLMKLHQVPGEHRYGVAVRDGFDLWLTLWVRRSPKGEFFVMVPRGDRDWDIHASYHLDGTLHMKSHGRRVLPPMKRQPLTGAFRGTENLGTFAGYGPKSVGAICDLTAFSGVVEIAPAIESLSASRDVTCQNCGRTESTLGTHTGPEGCLHRSQASHLSGRSSADQSSK